jgi:glycosyltransferase involved in cell wall biosynthesis
MKVLFLVSKLDNASTRQRVMQYRPWLEAAGIASEVVPAPRSLAAKLELWRELPRFDALFIQRRLFQPWEVGIIRRRTQHLVFDFDDAVMFKDRGSNQTQNITRRMKFRSMARRADLVIAGNRFLRAQAIAFNERVEILPTPVDMERYQPKAIYDSERVTIGWIGSRTTLRYLQDIQDVLEELGERYRHLQLKIVADRFFTCKHLPVVQKQWEFATEIDDLHSFDIGLMPLRDDPWCQGKCGFKLIQCMAVGVPVVCSPVGMNREIVQHGINGLWANDARGWLEALGALIERPRWRRELGAAGRKTVQDQYALHLHAPRLTAWLRQWRP